MKSWFLLLTTPALVVLVGCATSLFPAAPHSMATPVPPTATPVPPTATPLPPTQTPTYREGSLSVISPLETTELYGGQALRAAVYLVDHDSQPVDGGYPTAQWFADQTIVDRHLLAVDPHAPDGEYELEIGMYLLETMTRLPAVDAEGQVVDDRIVLGTFQFVQP